MRHLQPESSTKPSSDEASPLPLYDRPSPLSPKDCSSDEETLLPTYEQSTTLKTIIPEVTAPPEQVRAFLKHLLIVKRSLNVDHADQIASRWTTGTGHELRTYPPSMYFEVFGREDGWTVYREAKLWMFIYDGKKTWIGRTGKSCKFNALSHNILYNFEESANHHQASESCYSQAWMPSLCISSSGPCRAPVGRIVSR